MEVISAMLMSRIDHSRLVPLVADALNKQTNPVLDVLDEKLSEATLVSPDEIPADLVTMNSEILVEGPSKAVPRRLRLVYTAPDPAEEGKSISIFSPMGTALLGARVGDWVWLGKGAMARKLHISAISYQPESRGHWEL
jgi:regulator of nucleoside diphosphate kinase